MDENSSKWLEMALIGSSMEAATLEVAAETMVLPHNALGNQSIIQACMRTHRWPNGPGYFTAKLKILCFESTHLELRISYSIV